MATRREFLWQAGGGLGGIALAQLLAETGFSADLPKPELNGGLHHKAKVKRVIQLFMNGGVSQPDTFDYKPELEKRHDQPFQPGGEEKVEGVTSVPGKLMKSPFPFKQHGKCGRWVSSVFPHIAGCVDDLAFLMGVASKSNVHGPASYMMNTGFIQPGFPCLVRGCPTVWENWEIICRHSSFSRMRGLPYNQKGNFASGFLPVAHQGTILNTSADPPIADLKPSAKVKFVTPEADREGGEFLAQLNRRHAEAHPGDSRLEARIASYELAARMQQHAPETLDLSRETKDTHRRYGLDNSITADFGRRVCWLDECSNEACALFRSGVEQEGRAITGIITRTLSRNCRPSPGRSISQ